ncbi:TPA: hypothetical protein ACGF6D_001782 [Vibrio cholerae]|uniref:Tetratricopeptide repeat protein n=1 Tax=Vibrio tarriae TaxID=2014742 RepID=A0AAU8WNL7_9VIBR|nr:MULTISPECIES: hypothetical protein [Vibrio]ASK53556.1 hypothetical protein CEQ48_01760 [Vibrio tarriae]EKF9298392.1 hypothetical protein [Vibrio cholerae]EKF9936164.1 hypothetical protein [Vibrio cholerae]ELW1716119.1 hypothetical protein [Vibrio cholerae]EMC8145442.1 hypothetical protein [Vibrio cholerae]
MKIRTSLSLTAYVAVLLFTLSAWPVFALPSEAMIQRYNQAAQGDEKLVEPLYADLEKLVAQEGATALSLVYLGSTRTLMGRDAFLPWKKMRYSEEGLAMIEKGLSLLSANTSNSEEIRNGLPVQMLAMAVAAATYTSMPDMFNHFERGYDLYLNLLADPQFQTQPFAATAWIYRLAIVAALRAKDEAQARLWLETMQQADAQHPDTQQVQALLSQG